MAKKEKKGKKEKAPKKSRKERRKEAAAARESWIYYSDSSVSLIVGVLVIFCLLDVVLAIYAISYAKRVERENAVMIEAANRPVERSSSGEAWFLQKDGSIVYANAPAQPDIPSQESEPAIPGQEDEPAQTGGEEPAQTGGEEPAQTGGEEPAQTGGEEPAQASEEPAQTP